MSFSQGFFKPLHPEKYVGDVNRIRYMSSWELVADKFFDNNPNVLRWSSETIAIPYIKPTDKKIHRYFPDYWIEYKDKTGKVIHEIVEIKPYDQVMGKFRAKKTKNLLAEQVTYAINKAKWIAAVAYCNQQGWKFRIITERQLFGKVNKK